MIRIGYFGTFTTSAFIVIILFCRHRLNDVSLYTLSPTITTLIVGDSHTQCAIDDSLLPNALNISNSADSYLHSYMKIKRLLKHNGQLKTVMLSYAGYNLSAGMENWNFRDENLRNKVSQYLPLMEWGECLFLFERKPFSFLMGAIKFPKTKLKALTAFDDPLSITDIGMGGYVSLTNDIADWQRGRKIEVVKAKAAKYVMSESQKKYLNEIRELCEQYEAELVLISTPVHSTFPVTSDGLASAYYTMELAPLKWIDFNHLSLPDSCFADYEHLNKYGSAFFSGVITQELQLGL